MPTVSLSVCTCDVPMVRGGGERTSLAMIYGKRGTQFQILSPYVECAPVRSDDGVHRVGKNGRKSGFPAR